MLDPENILDLDLNRDGPIVPDGYAKEILNEMGPEFCFELGKQLINLSLDDFNEAMIQSTEIKRGA